MVSGSSFLSSTSASVEFSDDLALYVSGMRCGGFPIPARRDSSCAMRQQQKCIYLIFIHSQCVRSTIEYKTSALRDTPYSESSASYASLSFTSMVSRGTQKEKSSLAYWHSIAFSFL